MFAQSDPPRVLAAAVDPRYYYRRSLGLRELMPALGAAAVAALATFYVAKLFLERTPLGAEPAQRERSSHRPRLRLHRSDAEQSSSARNFGRR